MQRQRRNPNPRRSTLLVTGAAGYVGRRILTQAIDDPRVGLVLAIDARPAPPSFRAHRKVRWVQARLEQQSEWEEVVWEVRPDVCIHAAWRIRIPYGAEARVRAENLGATRTLARVLLSLPLFRRFVFVSSAAVFGAFQWNDPSYTFAEEDMPQEREYPYGFQKREAERLLQRLWQQEAGRRRAPVLRIARPVTIVGPAAREREEPFALTTVLAGKAPQPASVVARILQRLLRVFPAPASWRRQYVHEDDVAQALLALALEEGTGSARQAVAVYHLAAPGAAVDPLTFARLTGRPWLKVAPWMVRAAFWIAWHLSRGGVPTCRDVWRFYSYPIVLDGSRITREFPFSYRATGEEALRAMLQRVDAPTS